MPLAVLDPAVASRWQFAITTFTHIIFPIISMGLAPFLVYFTWREINGSELYARMRRFWLKIFALSFVMGTVTGIVLEFEFGTNFAAFSSSVGGIFGAPLATEGLMAFFLESAFLGIFLFGRDRVSDRMYLLSGILTGLGSWLSAVWILIANSWMQTPRGYEVLGSGGETVVNLVDPVAAYFNPRFPWMFVHMETAAVISASLFIAGIAAYKLRRGGDREFWCRCLKVALVVLILLAPFQVFLGHLYGEHVYHTQPQKFAAMEALWETEDYVPLYFVALPAKAEDITNPRAKDVVGIGIPGGASWLASGGNASAEIRGLNDFEGSPPVAIIFWSFRIMVALGFWFLVLAFWSAVKWWSGEIYEDEVLLKSLELSTVLGIFAAETGWITTEVGRQPWIIQGVMRTVDGVSPGLTGTEATLTLAGFVLLYTALLGIYAYTVKRVIDAGPGEPEEVAE